MTARQKGVSLVELLLVVVAIGFLGLLIANIPSSVTLIAKSKHQSLAREIASKQIEDKRAIQYINLIDGEEEITDIRLASLPGASGQAIISNCSSTICGNGEATKKVEAIISWKESGKDQSIKLETLISEGGLNQ